MIENGITRQSEIKLYVDAPELDELNKLVKKHASLIVELQDNLEEMYLTKLKLELKINQLPAASES